MLENIKAKIWLRSVSKADDLNVFWELPLKFLFGEQLKAICAIVDEELVKSYHFGLKITREHVLKEKTIILNILNSMGNLCSIEERFSFEEARSFFMKNLYHFLTEESKFYFNKMKELNEVGTKYNCHLEAVAASLLNSIFNKDGKIPYV